MQDHMPLGDLLISKGKLTAEQLETALEARRGQRRRLGDVLVSLGYVTENDIAESLGQQYDLEVVDVLDLTPDPMALRLLDTEAALGSRILPLSIKEDSLECVIADPIDVTAMDLVTRATDKHIVFRIAPISALLQAIRIAYCLPNADRRRADPGANRKIEERRALIDVIDDELGHAAVLPMLVED